MRGPVYSAKFYEGEIEKLRLWLADLGLTPEHRNQLNKQLESAGQHLAELEPASLEDLIAGQVSLPDFDPADNGNQGS